MITIDTMRDWILADISKERDRQLDLFAADQIDCDCSDPITPIKDKISALAEEFAEFVIELRAIGDGDISKETLAKAKTEGRQLAAVTVAILESLEEKL
jgi:hypothetical protein